MKKPDTNRAAFEESIDGVTPLAKTSQGRDEKCSERLENKPFKRLLEQLFKQG